MNKTSHRKNTAELTDRDEHEDEVDRRGESMLAAAVRTRMISDGEVST
jgi:hypothetical protein